MPDSLVAKWLVRPLAAASIVTGGQSGGLPTSVGSTTTTTTPSDGVVLKPTKLGINLFAPDDFNRSRPFSNLVLTSYWGVNSSAKEPASSYFDANGAVIKLNPGDTVSTAMSRPNALYRGQSVDVVCRWEGKGTVVAFNNGNVLRNISNRPNEIRFTQVTADYSAGLKVTKADPANTVSNMDCREAGSSQSQFFDPGYLANLSRYNTIRFMDWQGINSNRAVTWATRSRLVGQNFLRGADGYPLEVMIRLANETHTNPWFCIPWNADDDYVRKFAQLVKDTLDPTLVAYVEASNEVWNWGFQVATQASNEGLAENLSTNKSYALVYRYAEKTAQVIDIWNEVFGKDSTRIVRVIAWQHSSPSGFEEMLHFRDTASKVDAIASAPYLDYSLDAVPVVNGDLSPVFAQMRSRIDMHVNNSKVIKAAAAKYGNKRVITYEGGQHVLGQDVATQWAIQHDPRMQDIYSTYLRAWQQNNGDLLTLYADNAPTTKYGAWGLLDNAGQAPGDTPKGKAVMLFQASISKNN